VAPAQLEQERAPIGVGHGLEGITEYSPDLLRRQKEYIDAMLAIEVALKLDSQGLEQLIQQKTKHLDDLRWSMRLVEAQINKLKKLRDAERINENPRANGRRRAF